MTTSTTTDAAPNAKAPNTITVTGFFADEQFDFLTRSVIGYAAKGVMDVGEVFATIANITDGDADSWYAAWRKTADKFHERATAALVSGHTATANSYFLAAAEAYSQTNAVADRQHDQSLFSPAFDLQIQCWEAFIDSTEGRAQRIAVPYSPVSLPGYLFRPDNSDTPRPTLVMTNGSEGSLSGLWAWGVATANARGWNAFVYDGPGQQTMLFHHNVPFRPDWEAVLTPVVDSLIGRPDVDASALVAYGCSQAGYWLPRALAFEHRFVAAAADPGVMDVSTKWLENIPAELIALLQAGNKEVFNGAIAEVAGKDPMLAQEMAARGRPFAQPTAYDTFKTAMGYNLRDIVGQIVTPTLITNPDDESFWPGQSQQLHDNLTGEREIAHFLREDGANFHCEPMGRIETECRIFDFLQDHLDKRN
jgi:hypothetical protein